MLKNVQLMISMVMQPTTLTLVRASVVAGLVASVVEQADLALKISLKVSSADNLVAQDDQMHHKEVLIYNIVLILVLKKQFLVKKRPLNINVKKNVTHVMVQEQKKGLVQLLALSVMVVEQLKLNVIHRLAV